MINKCNGSYFLLTYKPSLLYRKKPVFTNLLSFWLNIFYILVLITLVLCFIIQYIHDSVSSIYSYYTPLPATINMSMEISLIDSTTQETIRKPERLIKLSLVESLITSSIIFMTNVDKTEQIKKDLYRPIGNDFTYDVSLLMFRNESDVNTISLDIELCKDDYDTRCESKESIMDILEKAILQIEFPMSYYDSIEYRTKTIYKNFQLKLVFTNTNLFVLTMEPQAVLEDCRLCFFSSNISKYVMSNNYLFSNIQQYPEHDNSKYKILFILSNTTNNIIIKHINLFKQTMPVMTCTFLIVYKLFNIIFKNIMQCLYKGDFTKELDEKLASFKKKNTTVSLMQNNKVNISSKPLTHKNGHRVLGSSPILNSQPISVFHNGGFGQLIHKRRSEIGINPMSHHSNLKKRPINTSSSNMNPPTVIRINQNLPPTFNENQNSSVINFVDNSLNQSNNNMIIVNEHPSVVQHFSFPYPSCQNISKVHPSNPTMTDKNKSITSTICCCSRVKKNRNEQIQQVHLQKNIKKYTSIDEIVFQLYCFEKYFVEIQKLVEAKKLNEAQVECFYNESSGL